MKRRGTKAIMEPALLSPSPIQYSIRRSPAFVGESFCDIEKVHYIAPHWEDLPNLLSGLQAVSIRTAGRHPLIRADIVSFSFVFLHPLVDGNGRISRILINDTLRRDGVVPEPLVLPLSVTIIHSPKHPKEYDQALVVFSRPFMDHYRDSYRFAEDGVRFNLDFDAYEDALPAWRYPDLTAPQHLRWVEKKPFSDWPWPAAECCQTKVAWRSHLFGSRLFPYQSRCSAPMLGP